MRLSQSTLDIIEAIKNINAKSAAGANGVNGAVFKQGNIIKARRHKVGMPIIRAEINEEFPQDFAIANLQKFLSMWSLLDDPDIKFEDDKAIFRSGKNKASIRYARAELIEDPEFFNKDIKMPSRDIEFELSDVDFRRIKTAASQFASEEIAILGDGEKIYITTYNANNENSDKFSIEVGETDKTFNLILGVEHLQFPRQDYKVTASFKKIIEFYNIDEATGNKTWFYFTCSERSTVE